MRGDSGGIDPRQAGHQAQQGKGDKGQAKRQDQTRNNRGHKFGIHPVTGHAGPAFEPDGKQQIQRYGLGRSLGDGQVGPGESGCKAQNERQDDRG